jgi:hypothetical protein
MTNVGERADKLKTNEQYLMMLEWLKYVVKI